MNYTDSVKRFSFLCRPGCYSQAKLNFRIRIKKEAAEPKIWFAILFLTVFFTAM
jgi:hypothetical protein